MVLKNWISNFSGPFFFSDKLDGASAQLWKDHNGNIMLYSRGDGTEGQDISNLTSLIFDKNTLNKIPNGTSIRGELIISIKNFNNVSDYMKNARNAVAGLVNSKTVDNKIAKNTDFVAYSILSPRFKYSEQMKKLESWKINTVKHKKVNTLSHNILSSYLTERKSKSLYEIDGIVCIDDSVLYEHKGGFPEHAFAYKMITADQLTTATVEDVLWELSMDGYIKPTIKIKPVNLKGVTVTYTAGFNAKFIVDNNIGPGSKITIIRSGDVIPYVLEVLSPSKKGVPKLPEYPYNWNHTEVDFVVKKLEGESKRIVTIKLLMHFFEGIGVKYMGEGIITKLVNNKYDSVEKILNADKKKLANIDGIGDTTVENIFDEIDRAFSEISLVKFMSASHKFGRGLAEKKLQNIIDVYPNILNKKWSEEEMIEKIKEVDGFSEKLASLFASNFSNFKNFYSSVSKIKKLSNSTVKIVKNAKLTGKYIVFTGKRDKDLENKIISHGGKVENRITKTSSYLVHDDNSDKTSSKFENAKKNNTTVLSKTDFKLKYNM